jgi:hypothetical protein
MRMFGDDIARDMPWVGGGTLLWFEVPSSPPQPDDDDDVISVDGDILYPPFPPPRMASRQEQHPPIGVLVLSAGGDVEWDEKERE